MKRMLGLKLPPFFLCRVGEGKRAAILNQTWFSQKRVRSSIVLEWKKIFEQLSRTRFLAGKKMAGFSNPVKYRVLKSYSNIFCPLGSSSSWSLFIMCLDRLDLVCRKLFFLLRMALSSLTFDVFKEFLMSLKPYLMMKMYVVYLEISKTF